MRLAKGFFLPFLAAEWLLYRCRAPTGGQPPANRPEFTEPVGDMNTSSSSSASPSRSQTRSRLGVLVVGRCMETARACWDELVVGSYSKRR